MSLSYIAAEKPLLALDPELLNINQRRAYDIITWHLNHSLNDDAPPPLRMITNGEGGVGKSQVIQSVTEYFRAHNVLHLLWKNAYTGVAASLIEGQTYHTAAMISHKKRPLSSSTKTKLEHAWRDALYDITDKFSMLGKTFFAHMSLNITIRKSVEDNNSQSFSIVNVILFRDPHQFPPIECSIHEALFFPTDGQWDSTLCQVGREVYLKFTMVVTLKQQIRVIDPIWHDFLHIFDTDLSKNITLLFCANSSFPTLTALYQTSHVLLGVTPC